MLSTEERNNSETPADDGPSVLGRFTWAVVGRTCVPCLLKNDNTRYVSVRIAESEVLGHFLHKLNTEVFNCISVKSFGITEAENKLLNEINVKHCESLFGKELFTIGTDFIVRLDDLIEFYKFMDICYNKLLLQNATNDRSNKCGFVRINDDSVVPYAVKNNQKYVPLFYFEGETDSLKTRAINLDNWDLAYLKFCCKVQGIKNELFASEKCMVTSLDDVKSYFPEGTKFDDYWPAKIFEMQQPPNRAQMNGNHSWVQTPPVVTSTVPPAQSSVPANKALSTNMSRQLHTNQRVNAPAVMPNLTSNLPVYQSSAWSNTSMSNSAAAVSSSSYPSHQQRVPPKMNSGPMHSMNANSVTTPRTYVNPSMRLPTSTYYPPPVNVPAASGPIPSLVRVSSANSIPNVYDTSMSNNAYSPPIYQSNNRPIPQMVAVSTRHVGNATSTSQQQQQQQMKSRTSNQAGNSTMTRYPQTLNSLNGTSNVIQTCASTTSLNPVPNNVNNLMPDNRPQQHRSNFIQSGGEIIDLSSPPHSPQHNVYNVPNTIPAGLNSSHNHPNLPPLQRICDASQLMTNTMPQYKIETVNLFDKSVPAINLNPYSDAELAISLQDIIIHYFPGVEMNKLRNWLQNVLSIDLYEASPTQTRLLRDYCNSEGVNDGLPLICARDFESNYPRITYLAGRDQGIEPDSKRHKVS